MIKTVMTEVTRLYDLPQVPMIKTDMSEVTHLYDQPQVLMIKTVMSEVTRLYAQPQVLMIKTVISEVTRMDTLTHQYITLTFLQNGHPNTPIHNINFPTKWTP